MQRDGVRSNRAGPFLWSKSSFSQVIVLSHLKKEYIYIYIFEIKALATLVSVQSYQDLKFWNSGFI